MPRSKCRSARVARVRTDWRSGRQEEPPHATTRRTLNACNGSYLDRDAGQRTSAAQTKRGALRPSVGSCDPRKFSSFVSLLSLLDRLQHKALSCERRPSIRQDDAKTASTADPSGVNASV